MGQAKRITSLLWPVGSFRPEPAHRRGHRGSVAYWSFSNARLATAHPVAGDLLQTPDHLPSRTRPGMTCIATGCRQATRKGVVGVKVPQGRGNFGLSLGGACRSRAKRI